MERHLSFSKQRIGILLLESIHRAAVDRLRAAGCRRIEKQKGAYTEDRLLRCVSSLHILGIRSKTRVNERTLAAAQDLLAVGCFCIGTDQVDLDAATRRGVAVFNAPFGNTRSVAELTIADVIMLARRAVQRSMELHAGRWNKSAEGCMEVRQKTIGIIGYGHIGPQVGLLAEALGMKVVFHDIVKKLPLGNARQVDSLAELLRISDFVTLHVPDTPLTRGMIGREQTALMRKGSYLLNLSRGSVVDAAALRQAIVGGHLQGAALDVYPEEPSSADEPFVSELRGLPNVILTPHIGGSTEEAQRNIATEVSEALVDYIETGNAVGCVNLPEVELPVTSDSHRVLNIHKDVPGVLGSVNGLVASMGVNIKAQSYNTRKGIGYLIMDVERSLSREVKRKIDELDTTIRTRILS